MTHAEMQATAQAPASLPSDKELVMRVMPMPADSNMNGDIFGGWIMAQVDIAGSVLPARLSRGRVTTVAVNQFIFKQPVSIGDLLSFYATVERIGNTSITVRVEVYAERNPADVQVVKVTEANLTVNWTHTLGAVISVLIAAGLRLEFFHEHDYTLFPRFEALVRDPGGKPEWYFPEGMPRMPLMYSLRASKEGP